MTCTSVNTMIVLTAAVISATRALTFSWDTPPVFYHSCNFSGRFSSEALDVIAKFPMVTIEKGQGIHDASDNGSAEDKMLATLKEIKQRNKTVATIFYYNSLMDWRHYDLHQVVDRHEDWKLTDIGGEPCTINGDETFPDHTGMSLFDFRNPGFRQTWINVCKKMVQTGYVDGCFSDRAADPPPHCEVDANYMTAKKEAHQQLQRQIGSNHVLIANHAFDWQGVGGVMIENFTANEESIKLLMDCTRRGKVTQVRAGMYDSCDDITHTLAAFLIGAGENSYYACNNGWKIDVDPVNKAWHPEYSKKLGNPTGLAVKNGNVYTRSFKPSSGGITMVTFDVSASRGAISWAEYASPALLAVKFSSFLQPTTN